MSSKIILQEGEIKKFSEKLKLREFIMGRPPLQEILKEIQGEIKGT